MHERLHDFLASCPDGAGSVDLLALVFRSPVSDSDFGRGFLRSLLAGDPRFEESEEGHWETVDGHLLTLACDQTPFVVVDLETTGERAGVEGITEIGAIRLEGTREVSRFETLVNPGRRIPPYVAKLTGITDGMVAEAPPIEDVIGDFYRFAAGAVIVAHNAAFDVAVLDRECVRCLNKHLGLPSLCTLKLCRRLLPDLGKASLDALADSFKLAHDTRHRAMADAELTVGVLGHLLNVFGQDHETTAGALLAFAGQADLLPVDNTGRYFHVQPSGAAAALQSDNSTNARVGFIETDLHFDLAVTAPLPDSRSTTTLRATEQPLEQVAEIYRTARVAGA